MRNWVFLALPTPTAALAPTIDRQQRRKEANRPTLDPMRRVTVSVVIPVYNEKRWLSELVRRVEATAIDKEIILVDDGSTDGTREVLREMEERGHRVLYQPVNCGKGAALRLGFQQARGGIILVQDADLEYDPADYPALLQPIFDGQADVVYGSRFLGTRGHQARHLVHYLANRLITAFSNIFTGLHLTDMETCYKVFRREALDGAALTSDRFGFEPEVTAKIAARRPRWRIREIPVGYTGRSYEEGKKIRFRDALQAVYCVVRHGLFG